jgi:hypothetical protein
VTNFWDGDFLQTRPSKFFAGLKESFIHSLEAEEGLNIEKGCGRDLMGVTGSHTEASSKTYSSRSKDVRLEVF